MCEALQMHADRLLSLCLTGLKGLSDQHMATLLESALSLHTLQLVDLPAIATLTIEVRPVVATC